jgi:hypothetical protein
MINQELTGRSLMLFGKYQGYELKDVPPGYLLWIYDNLTLREDLKEYIDERRDSLEADKKRIERNQSR